MSVVCFVCFKMWVGVQSYLVRSMYNVYQQENQFQVACMPGMMIMMTHVIDGYRLYGYMITTDFLENYITTINSRMRVIEHIYIQFQFVGQYVSYTFTSWQ